MAGPVFAGDPLSGSGTITYADGTTVDADLAYFTGGRFYIANGALIDTQDVMNPLTIGRAGPFTMSEYRGGRYNLVSQTQLGAVNRPLGGELLRMIDGIVNVLSPSGDVLSFSVDPIPVAKVGYQWVAYPRTDGSTGYTTTRGPFRNNSEVEQALGAGFRLATATEAIYSAVFRQILQLNQELVNRVIEEHGLEADEAHTAESKAANLIIEAGGLQNIRSFSSYLVE